MPECIFCEEYGSDDLSEDCTICPDCGNPPFSGMMFDKERKEEADRLETEGDLIGAWDILSEEWKSHTDIDYYDEEMATKILQWIDNLFERNPEMIEQKVSINLMRMASLHYWGGHNEALEVAEKTIEIAKDAGRVDLELEILNSHLSIQKQRFGGIESLPQYRDLQKRIKDLEKQMAM
mgnify:CR=1 FL=1